MCGNGSWHTYGMRSVLPPGTGCDSRGAARRGCKGRATGLQGGAHGGRKGRGREREGGGGAHLGVQIWRSPSPKPRAPRGREREVAAREKSNEREGPGGQWGAGA